jgi:hypothetical protein
MIPGITASEIVNITPSTAIPYAIADFVNGIYTYNASTVALSAVITDEVPTLVSASGLHLIAGHNAIPFVSNFYTALFTFNWTIVFDLNIDGGDNEHVILNVGSETVTFGYTNEIFAINYGDWEFQDQNNDYPGTPPGTGTSQIRFLDDTTHALTNAIHKFGITRTNAFCSLSVDGFAAQTLNTPTFSINPPAAGYTDVKACTGAYRFAGNTVPNSFYLRKMQIFNPVSNADLVALTA